MDVAIAVDVGGTKVAAARVGDDGRVLARAAAPTPTHAGAGAEEVWAALAGVVDQVRDGDEVVCGVGCGGPMEPGGVTVSPLNIGGWRGFPLRARLAELTGLPVAVDNDAKALALGEGWQGGGRGERDFLAMVVSTGVGGGIVLDGRLLDGARGNAGHIGHVIVEPGGRLCACGARGCLEAEASGEVRARTGRLVGRAVASVANLLDLRLALVAGSVALGYGEDFFAAARAELERSARIEFARGARIEPAHLGADGPLVGAAAVGWRALDRDLGLT